MDYIAKLVMLLIETKIVCTSWTGGFQLEILAYDVVHIH